MYFYKIGEIGICINSDFLETGTSWMDLFSVTEDEWEKAPHKIKYKVIHKNIDLTPQNLLVSKSDQEIYCVDHRYYRLFYKIGSGRKCYACTVIEDGVSDYAEIWVPPDEKHNMRSLKLLLNVMCPEATFLSAEAMILHASNILVDGKSILFTAPSQTGKTTQALLWERCKGAKIVNGDRVLLSRSEDGEYQASGLPFCGSSNMCENRIAPVKLIVVLEQGETNQIREISRREAFVRVFEQITMNRWMPESYQKIGDMVQELVENVSCVCLQCTPDEEAVSCLEKYLMEV